MMENVLEDLGWFIDTDKPAHGTVGSKPGGERATDVALELISPVLTSKQVTAKSMVLEAQRMALAQPASVNRRRVEAGGGTRD